MTYPERIETSRLELRWATESDAEELFERCTSDPRVTLYLLWPPHQTVDQTREFIRTRAAEREAGNAWGWTIRRKSDGAAIGSIGCRHVEPHVLQFGYYLSQSAWGNGYTTEATSALVPIWLTKPDVWRVQAFCDPENVASARVLAKSGLRHEGTLRRYVPTPNLCDVPRDAHLFAAVRED